MPTLNAHVNVEKVWPFFLIRSTQIIPDLIHWYLVARMWNIRVCQIKLHEMVNISFLLYFRSRRKLSFDNDDTLHSCFTILMISLHFSRALSATHNILFAIQPQKQKKIIKFSREHIASCDQLNTILL